MAFRDIIKKQRQSGKGFISSIGYASGASLAEKIDPRNILFKKGSLLNALFPNVKGFQASTGKTDSIKKSLESPVVQNVSNEELTKINVQLSVIGKNTMSLPIMMRDINVMRQSMVKLVRLQGGTQQDKADRFFSRSKEMESLYESNLNARKGSSTSPTSITSPKEKTWLEKIADFFGNGLLSFLLKSGAVLALATGIGKYFTSPEFRAFINTAIQKMFDTIDSVLKVIFGDDYKEKIKEVFLDIAKNAAIGLGVGIAAVVAVFATFQIALNALVAAVSAAAAKIASSVGLPGGMPDIPDGPDKKKPTGKPGKPGKLGGAAAAGRAALPGIIVGAVLAEAADQAESADMQNPGSNIFANVAAGGKAFADWFNDVFGKDDAIKARREANRAGLGSGATNTTPTPAPRPTTIDTQIEDQEKITQAYGMRYSETMKNRGQDAAETKQALADYEKQGERLKKLLQVKKEFGSGPGSPSAVPKSANEAFEYELYRKLVAQSESSNNYAADNKVGFLGKYQFGAQALETYGYIKSGASKDRNSVYSPQNWTGKDGIKSKEDFFNSPQVQDKVMQQFTQDNKNQLEKSGVITNSDDPISIAAKLYAAHHGGVGGAQALYLKGENRQDFAFAGSSVAGSATKMAAAYRTGEISNQPWSNQNTAVAQLPPMPSRPSTAISTPSITMADAARTQMQTPVVVNAPTSNIQQASNQRQGQYTSPAVVDSEFMKLLVSRVT